VSRHRTHRKDSTQDAIVEALRRCGCAVWPIGEPCDLLVKRGGRLFLIDCEGTTKYRKRDAAQLVNFLRWGVLIAHTPEEALACTFSTAPVIA
jgi:hypothetical protein